MMRKIAFFAFLALNTLGVLWVFTTKAWAEASREDAAPRVLIVVSGHGKDAGNTQPGFEFDEFSKAYLVFKRHGLAVDIASPKGGAVEPDRYDPNKPHNKEVLQDSLAMGKLKNSLATKGLNPANYAGVFVVGGKGAMFDLPDDAYLQRTIARVYENGGIIAAVCHGPAALVNVVLSDGVPLVHGKRVNGFTNREEQLFGQKWLPQFDFMLEDKLKQQGGRFEAAAMMLNYVVVDGRLITGQNPFSTVTAAEKLVHGLGMEVNALAPDKEELTLALIARLLDGDEGAAKAFAASPDAYRVPLIGMYGYYYLQQAKTDSEVGAAVLLMSMVAEQIKDEKIQLALARGHQKLGDITQARRVAEKVLENNPEAQNAKQFLASLHGK